MGPTIRPGRRSRTWPAAPAEQPVAARPPCRRRSCRVPAARPPGPEEVEEVVRGRIELPTPCFPGSPEGVRTRIHQRLSGRSATLVASAAVPSNTRSSVTPAASSAARGGSPGQTQAASNVTAATLEAHVAPWPLGHALEAIRALCRDVPPAVTTARAVGLRIHQVQLVSALVGGDIPVAVPRDQGCSDRGRWARLNGAEPDDHGLDVASLLPTPAAATCTAGARRCRSRRAVVVTKPIAATTVPSTSMTGAATEKVRGDISSAVVA